MSKVFSVYQTSLLWYNLNRIMKTAIALVILFALYLSFLFGNGILYSASQDVLNWLNAEHGKSWYLGLTLLLAGIVAYFFILERTDKRKDEKIANELIKNIKSSGVYATTTSNTGFGEVHLEAMITFQDSGFILRIKQISNGDRALLVDQKFLSWKELLKYIELETEFSVENFLPEASHELQLLQKDAHAK